MTDRGADFRSRCSIWAMAGRCIKRESRRRALAARRKSSGLTQNMRQTVTYVERYQWKDFQAMNVFLYGRCSWLFS